MLDSSTNCRSHTLPLPYNTQGKTYHCRCCTHVYLCMHVAACRTLILYYDNEVQVLYWFILYYICYCDDAQLRRSERGGLVVVAIASGKKNNVKNSLFTKDHMFHGAGHEIEFTAYEATTTTATLCILILVRGKHNRQLQQPFSRTSCSSGTIPPCVNPTKEARPCVKLLQKHV